MPQALAPEPDLGGETNQECEFCATLSDMGSCSVPCEPINQYALVTYLPDELGCFLDQLRRDLVAQCNARSHLSLLPPRPLNVSSAEAESQIHSSSRTTRPFVVRIDSVAVFPKTSVVYLELSAGMHELSSLHDRLAVGAFEFDEPFPFHPHITLAQNFEAETVRERFELAKRKWQEYTGPREFLLDRLVFVQNSSTNCWTDLRAFSLLGLPGAPALSQPAQLSQTY